MHQLFVRFTGQKIEVQWDTTSAVVLVPGLLRFKVVNRQRTIKIRILILLNVSKQSTVREMFVICHGVRPELENRQCLAWSGIRVKWAGIQTQECLRL